MRFHEQGYCPHEIETGEKICRSELTSTVYRVTRWVELGDGKIVALHKEPAKQSEVIEHE
jgi:hypothetical protein